MEHIKASAGLRKHYENPAAHKKLSESALRRWSDMSIEERVRTSAKKRATWAAKRREKLKEAA